MKKTYVFALFLLLFVCTAPSVGRADFYAGTWNLESGDSDSMFLAKQIEQWSTIDLWGFSEVQNAKALETVCKGMARSRPGSRIAYVLGNTGRADRLAIVYDENVFQYFGSIELNNVNVGGTLRAPLVAKFQERATGVTFLFVTNHFYRGKSSEEARRNEQSRRLREWAASQDLPVISVGDYNFDCDVEDGKCNSAFYDLVKGDTFSWVKPQNPMRTQCNRRYNSILDFIFSSGIAQGWAAESVILNDHRAACDDNKQKSDHRPVVAVFSTSGECSQATQCN